MLIDIHTHRKKNLQTNETQVISIDYRDEAPEEIFYTYGVHPWLANETTLSNLNESSFMNIINSKNCLGLGELGLDFVKKDNLKYQIEVLEWQINLLDKVPFSLIVFHCVKAYENILTYIKKIEKEHPHRFKFLFHDYNGNVEQTLELLKYNTYFSYGKKVFQPQTKGFKSLKEISISRIFCETDDSDIEIIQVYEAMAKIKNVPVKELVETIQKSFSQLRVNS